MKKTKTQKNLVNSGWEELKLSITQVTSALLGGQQIFGELSAAAARYNGLIDYIERAGWDIATLERVKHAFDGTAQRLLKDLLDTYPAMSEGEQHAFLEPFQLAIHQFAHMNAREKSAFRSEYSRFEQLRERSKQELVAANAE